MKKIIIFFSMALLLSFGVNAQTLSTDTFNEANANLPAVGSNFNIPIDITAVGEIFILTVYLEYDNTILNYTGFANSMVTNTVIDATTLGIIKVTAASETAFAPITFPDGKLVDLQFDYIGGDTDLTFWTTEYGTYPSSIFKTDFSTDDFINADVTNGAVDGDFYDATINGGDWHTATNWESGFVANAFANVTVDGTVVRDHLVTTISADAVANDVTVIYGGELTLDAGFTLTATGNFLIESGAAGSGSFINNGTLAVTGTQSAQCFVGDDLWHGIAAPVSGEDFNAMFYDYAPEVWVSGFDEATGSYAPVSDLNTSMGDMKGWFSEIETGQGGLTHTFVGTYRTGTVGAADNMLHAGDGWNFVGNAFTSAIDWEAASGWTKTNVNDAIYIYNGSTWLSYVNGAGTGTQYIAMSQGFFVQSTAVGTLTMDESVCVHNPVAYLKSENSQQQIVKLEVNDNGSIDGTIIRFADNATADFDGDLDAYKLFTFENGYPQIFTTANGNMSINSLPFSVLEESVALDVIGTDGNMLTISVTDFGEVEELYLKDESTGDVTNLKTASYSFVYDAEVSDRFTLVFFDITDVDENIASDNVKIYASDKNIQIILDGFDRAEISVYNLLGQMVTGKSTTSLNTSIPIEKSGYYLVKVSDGANVITKKVFIK